MALVCSSLASYSISGKWYIESTPFKIACSNNMNRIIRATFYIFLIFALGWLISLRIRKLISKETVVSLNHEENGVELPSITFCVKWLSNKTENTIQILPRNGLSLLQSTDWDFDEYQQKSFEIRNIILSGQFSDQPDDKASK